MLLFFIKIKNENPCLKKLPIQTEFRFASGGGGLIVFT